MRKCRVPQPPDTRVPPALSWSMAHLMSRRRLARERGAAAIVVLSLALTVATSLVVTCMVSQSGSLRAKQIGTMSLPVDAIVLFNSVSDASEALLDSRSWEGIGTMTRFPCLRTDSELGPLLILGVLDSIERGVMLCEPALAKDVGSGSRLEVWEEETGQPAGTWTVRPTEGYLPEGQYPKDWVWVHPDSLMAPERLRAVAVDITGETAKALTLMAKLSEQYPDSRVLMDDFARQTVRKAVLKAHLPWQAVSAMVAITSAAAVSCVLAVSFLGKKRALGILKVIGATRSDLKRLTLSECWYLGLLGVPAGLVIGAALCRFALGVPVPAVSIPVSLSMGALALAGGAFLPLRLVRNATCDQLLNNKAVYALSNPSCAQCGLCGGF